MNTGAKDIVLVVDDSPETLGMLNDTLETAGMTTLVALDGKQAINIAKKMLPDIILLDALMPGMDGFETCVELKKDNTLNKIPIIFMTGLTDTQHIVQGFESGGVDYVTKPINSSELIARIKVHLSNARITFSAQTALDTAGQNICAVNDSGEFLWGTPQVNELLYEVNNNGWTQDEFTRPISDWLNHNPSEGAHLNIKIHSHSLSFYYIGKSNQNETLLKLSNDDQPDEKNVLKDKFSVTEREADVLLWVAKGKTNREIAQILELSPRTINKHLEQIFKKLNVENRTSAAAIAVNTLR